MNEWRSDMSAEIAMNLTVRGVMVSNEMPVTGRWMPIRSGKNFLKSYGMKILLQIIVSELKFIFVTFRTVDADGDRRKYGISMMVSPNVLACDYRDYAKYIPLNAIDE